MHIKSLKDKVLQLAIQGKLVPQNENDEPASILLEKIKEEKEQLIKNKVIKKEKLLPEISEEEKLFDLPRGWEWCRLGSIGQIIGGGTPSSTNPEYYSENEIPWLTPADLRCYKEKYISNGNRFITKLGLEKSSARMLPIGSVLFSSRAPIGYVVINENEICTNQGFKSIVPYKIGMNEYIYYFLKYNTKNIEEMAAGTTFKEISGKGMSEVIIPVPPLEEQKRIVAKIESLFKLIDELDNNKQEVLQNISDTRNKVLHLAIQGKLVPQNENDEPASILLEKIKEEKEQLIKNKVIKKEKPLPEISEEEKLFELPRGWEWCRLCDITHSQKLNDGDWIVSSDMDDKGSVKLIQLGSIGDGKYLEKGFKNITNETFDRLKCKEICEGDILINRLLGKKMLACMLPKIEGRKITSVDTCFIKPNKDIYNSKFILYLVLSEYFQEKAYSKVAGTTRQRISKGNLITIVFPLPPLEEQRRIVVKIDSIMNYLDIIEKEIGN